MLAANEKSAEQLAALSLPQEVPILATRETVVFPSLVVPLAGTEEKSIKLIDEAMNADKIVGIFAQNPDSTEPPPAGLYNIGTAASITKMYRMPDGTVRALLLGVSRIRLSEITQVEPFLRGKIEPVVDEKVERTPTIEALTGNLASLFQKVVTLSPHLSDDLSVAVVNLAEPGTVADFIAAHISLKLNESQEILETLKVQERLEKLTVLINRELEILELRTKIQTRVKGEMDKAQREFLLREQLKAIQSELGETDERTAEIHELRARLEEAGLPPDVLKEAERELDRIARMSPQAAEYSMARAYVDWLASVPWSVRTEDNLDIAHAREVLDDDHYDLEKVKERILDYLAVRSLKKDTRTPILCFVGPPGTGKTSIGKSIARALGRKFVRISLGGIRDEAEIRGHRRTYVGALPGRIIQGLRRAGSNNPVFMLDEIDKVGADFRGDPSAALLEVLDPEQNYAFSDHYLEVPCDLSKVMFITTANLADPIPPALRDRMETLELPGYTELEKLHIARKFLIPKQLAEHGLTEENLDFTDEGILAIIRNYTREAGLRNLEREIGTICRKTARNVVLGTAGRVSVIPESLRDFLGQRRFRHEVAERGDEVGVATGLAWTPAGGDILFVESTIMPGKGSLTLTGQLGDVMQESARAALSYARSRAVSLGIDPDFYSKNDLHIHVPAGAIPKDGPSAGVTMAVSVVSLLTGQPVDKDAAM
ncbi:MAG: endopeptidase La, partial [Dehalococcoidia bacterium]|nr:endopeptidase La [Dehalococcoidia bacterium]